ncbi:LLM class flavin-dependent oxidoreductase [Stigmatella sp. ncwal1]|uniref:LLM class flavin-dependent oxidoreductase n=1 Tax=Stigmatella ashevillensis TaxID=2995309 RepID=A0ABT5D600_9BACT|nr:MupA/Atu3671 family FMN-dependent luciferase-like monooxygenase [Stigmatella ashevillena]MDC0708553.1 LLM class flavin-dependent oxidoreductase [Stigmatella ashevillena]
MDFSVYFFSANDQADFGARYRFILEVAKYVDRNNFKAIWTPERHFQEFGGSFPNPAVLSAALAVTTQNIQLRAGSVVVPHHHPARIAEEWALVDQLSQGRVGLCLATGWHRGDFIFYPENYTNRRDWTFGHIETLRNLWAGRPVTFPGVEGQPVEVRSFPRPHRKDLPLWLVHSSNPETWIKAGELGLNILTLLDNWDRLTSNIAAYRASLEKHGFDPKAGIVTMGVHTFIGNDDAKVRQTVAQPIKQYLSTFLTQRKADANLQGASKQIEEKEKEMLAGLAFEDMYEKRSLLGTLPKCANMVKKMQEVGVNEVACIVDFGLDFQTVLDALPQVNELRAMFEPQVPAAATAGMAWYYNR